MSELLDFSAALTLIRGGKRLARAGWNGREMFIFYIEGGGIDLGFDDGVHSIVEVEPHLMMKTADGKLVPWLASQTDLLATDWAAV